MLLNGEIIKNVFFFRTLNWQKFCLKDSGLLAFLLRVSVHLDDGVTPIILQLLQSALCPQPGINNTLTSVIHS